VSVGAAIIGRSWLGRCRPRCRRSSSSEPRSDRCQGAGRNGETRARRRGTAQAALPRRERLHCIATPPLPAVRITRGWPLRGAGLYAGLASTRGWPLRGAGLYAGLASTRGWPLRGAGLYAGLASTRGWPLRGARLCAGLASTRGWPLRGARLVEDAEPVASARTCARRHHLASPRVGSRCCSTTRAEGPHRGQASARPSPHLAVGAWTRLSTAANAEASSALRAVGVRGRLLQVAFFGGAFGLAASAFSAARF
jgi:hypothetical protein